MKKINIALCLLTIIAVCNLFSCHKSSSPVDQLVELMDEAAKKTEKISSIEDLNNVKGIVYPEEIWNIIKENQDYVLTDKDKDKLKKSYNKLMKAAYEKTCEYIPSEPLKKQAKKQLDIFMEGSDLKIDNAKTLGEIAP